VSVKIGSGTTSDNLSTINWSNGHYFLEIAVDVTGSKTYVVFGMPELLSVTYALFANNVKGTAFKSDSGLTNNLNLTDDFVFGSLKLDDDGDASHDNRMFYDKSKGRLEQV